MKKCGMGESDEDACYMREMWKSGDGGVWG